MKSLLLSFLIFLGSMVVLAQAPNALTYQAVARSASGAVIANQSIGLRLSVLNGTTPVFTETFTPQTNAYGMFTINLGTGAPTLGSFSAIDWSTGAKSLKTEMDLTGGTTYTDVGTTPFASVPYALIANRVANVSLDELLDVSAAGATANQVLRWNGTQWAPATLESISTSAALSGNGTTASPLTLATQGAIAGQVLQWNGTAWVPANVSGGAGDNWGSQAVQRNTTLDGNGTAASPLRIAQQGAAAGESLLWNGSTWSPGRPAVFLDNVFSGTGTSAASPIKLAQQGATNGQTLKWDNTAQTWRPKNSIELPLTLSDISPYSLTISNTADGIAISGEHSGGASGIGVRGFSENGRGVSGATVNGSGVYGITSTGVAIYGISVGSGLAGSFSGNVQVSGRLEASSGIQRPSDVYLFDQTSVLTVQNNTPTVIPGLASMNVTASAVTSAAQPAKIIFSVSIPIVSTASTVNEGYQMQMIIRNGASVVKQVNVNDTALSGSPGSLSHTIHHSVTAPGTYTASVQIFKGNATAAKDITVSTAQVQIQVINP